MTTIAWDGETLAADSRATGDYIKDDCQKIYKVGSIYFAFCGRLTSALLFIQWAKDRTKPKPSFDDDFEVLEIKDGKASYYDKNLVPLPVSKPYAIGSGDISAMTAMYLGCDAKKAVEVAKKFDECTGGKVKTVKP